MRRLLAAASVATLYLSLSPTTTTAHALTGRLCSFRSFAAGGTITLRHNSRLHHVGIGRRHAGTNVLVLVHDLHVRVLTTHGELLRELQLDPSKDYQPQPKT